MRCIIPPGPIVNLEIPTPAAAGKADDRQRFMAQHLGPAAASVANLSCTGNQGTVSSNPVQNNVMPLSLHAAPGFNSTLFQAVAVGVPFSSCTLNTLGSNGGAIQFTFNTVYVSTVTAVATSANSLFARTSGNFNSRITAPKARLLA